MNRIVLAGFVVGSIASAGIASARADSVMGCDGKRYNLTKPKSYDECMANGKTLNCPESKNAQYCRQHFPK